MKILVFADIHYPKCDTKEILEIIKKENPDKIILLGDVADEKEGFYIFIREIKKIFNKEITVICGDNEKKLSLPCKKYYLHKNILFLHGDIATIKNEKFTKIVAKILKKISKKLLLEFYFLRFLRYKKRKIVIVLGHSHLIGKSFLIPVYSIGTLTKKHYFSDRGFAIIENDKIKIIKLKPPGAAGI